MFKKGKNAVLMILVLALSLGAALSLPVVSQAATLQYYGDLFATPPSGGGIQVYSESSGRSLGVDGSNSNGGFGTINAAAGSGFVLPSWDNAHLVTGNTVGGGGFYGFPSDPTYARLLIEGHGHLDSIDDSAFFLSNAFCRTDYGREGLYLQLLPSAGEHLGDPVSVTFTWTASAIMLTGWSAYLSGSTESGDIKLTLNDYAGVGTILWSHSAITISPNNSFSDTYSAGLSLHIGDILGLHLGGGLTADLSGYLSPAVTPSFSNLMEFRTPAAVPLPHTSMLLGSGLLGLAGWRRYRKS